MHIDCAFLFLSSLFVYLLLSAYLPLSFLLFISVKLFLSLQAKQINKKKICDVDFSKFLLLFASNGNIHFKE